MYYRFKYKLVKIKNLKEIIFMILGLGKVF